MPQQHSDPIITYKLDTYQLWRCVYVTIPEEEDDSAVYHAIPFFLDTTKKVWAVVDPPRHNPFHVVHADYSIISTPPPPHHPHHPAPKGKEGEKDGVWVGMTVGGLRIPKNASYVLKFDKILVGSQHIQFLVLGIVEEG
jgi:hypothetical protein